jgi:hypothetical protein
LGVSARDSLVRSVDTLHDRSFRRQMWALGAT